MKAILIERNKKYVTLLVPANKKHLVFWAMNNVKPTEETEINSNLGGSFAFDINEEDLFDACKKRGYTFTYIDIDWKKK